MSEQAFQTPSKPTPDALVPDDEIGGWILDECIAEGPFSEVWRAHGFEHQQRVALKLARTELGARLLREEAAILRRLRFNTARVLRVIELYDEGPYTFLVMPFVARTFRDVLRQVSGGDSRAHALLTFQDVVAAVGEVHMLGVVHGDLKPENILIDPESGAYVADFGLAKQLRDTRLDSSLRNSLQTENEITGGTLAYMPPETVKGAEPSYQADVYSLGVMLHEVLLGRRPDKATSPQALRALLPEEVLEVLLRALAYDPVARYGRAGQLAGALRRTTGDLTLVGGARMAKALLRALLAGLAAFFVALRYTSVAAILVTYGALICVCVGIGLEGGPWWGPLFGFVPAALVHIVIRWQGPETPLEVVQRQAKARSLGYALRTFFSGRGC